MIRAIRSLRILRKHWKLTAIAVFSLSIAMALGVLSLSISNTFLLLSPAGPNPERLVTIYARTAEKDVDQISFLDYQYFREHNQVFTDIAAAPNSISLNWSSSEKGMVKVLSRPVSDNYFAVLGIRPLLGRLFAPGDDRSKADIAVMTYTCWKRLGSDPKIIGTNVGGHTIVGITPKEFTGSMYGVNGDLIFPLTDVSLSASDREKRDSRQLFLLARLKPGVTMAQARADVAALAGQLASAFPAEDKGRTAAVARASLLPPDGIKTAELVAAIMLTLVLLVLLIACANVANLLLAIAVGRRQEATIKLALGASRGRIIREFLKESAVICGLSGALGYAIAATVITRYSDFTITLPVIGAFSFSPNLRLDFTVLALTLGLMLIALLATGLAPAFYASSPHLAQVLSGEIAVGGTRKNVRRNILVIAQVAMCTLVLVGMGLCQRDLYNLRRVDPGFSARNLIAFPLYQDNDATVVKGKQFYREMRRQVSEVPGVEAVALVGELPLIGGPPETVQFPDGKKTPVSHTVVDSDYFSTMEINVLAGRAFSSLDVEGGPDVVVINQKMAEMFWPSQDPIGRVLTVGDPGRRAAVVGMVATGKYEDLDEQPKPFFYSALSQHYEKGANIVARTRGNPRQWEQPLTKIANGLGAFVLAPLTFDTWMNIALFGERMSAGIVAALSALGLLLAIIGLFGAISYSVSERKKELGIRVALGATKRHLFQMVLRQTFVIGGAGVAIGILLGVGATILLQSQFYQVHPVEWTVLVPVGAGMLGISLLVAYFSARPWVSVNPMEAVRHS